MVTTYTKHTSSKNMEATCKGIHKLYYTPVRLVATYANQNRSRNMEATFKGNHNTIVNPSCIGNYIY